MSNLPDSMTAAEYREYMLGKPEKSKGNKYGAKKVETEHGKFDSTGEKQRYDILLIQRKAGVITALSRQVEFDLNGIKYKADFVYYHIEQKKWIVEDFKGHKTDVYKNKKKLMKTVLGIEIFESHK